MWFCLEKEISMAAKGTHVSKIRTIIKQELIHTSFSLFVSECYIANNFHADNRVFNRLSFDNTFDNSSRKIVHVSVSY